MIIIVAAVVGIISFNSSPDSSNVGDCLKVTEFKAGSEPDKADCNDPAANVKIGIKLNSADQECPTDGTYDNYSVTGRSTNYKLCLVINAKQGDCLADFTSKTAGYKKVPCSDPTKDAEILQVIAGQNDKELCKDPAVNYALHYPQPALTMCIKGKE